MFALKISLNRFAVCASKPCPVSSACKNFRGQKPLGAEIQSVEKVDLGRSKLTLIKLYYFMDSGPKFTGLVWLNAGGIARDHMSFRFLADRTNGHAYATVLRLSVVCDVMYGG